MSAAKKILALLPFRRISGQIAALVIASLVVIHLFVTGFFLLHRAGEPPRFERPDHDLGTLAQLLNATPAAERSQFIERVGRAFPHLDVTFTAASDVASDAGHGNVDGKFGSKPEGRFEGKFDATADRADGKPDFEGKLDHGDRGGPPGFPFHLPRGFKAFFLPGPENIDRLGIRLPDGSVLTGERGPERMRKFLSPWMITLLFIVVSVTLLGLWAARALSAPLSAFAKAAESFSLDSEAAPLPESGPDEIRAAAKALNRMRARITTLMKDRTRMLAAISHDLRTPITRLRLRSEFIEDETHRQQMLGDLDQMRSMLESVLSFLRNDHTLEPMTLVDLTAILQQICDQFADLGHNVSYRGPGQLTITARPDDLHRAITNLVENAVKFGADVVIGLDVSGENAVIEVDDDGPGIDDARKAAMLEPFVRGDEARNMDEGGFGLGLSIAQSIILAHGGALSLLDREPHGLTARIVLPHRIAQKSAA